jgi:hydroxysqualene synthase
MVTSLDAAYDTCKAFARDHYENFPVASWLLPRRMRPHIAAVYAFARVADDFADEGERPDAERLALLDAWLRWLHAGAAGQAPAGPLVPGMPPETPRIFEALGSTIRTCELPLGLFEDLLSAFQQDVTTRRYDTWDHVLDYCRRSANPVGRVVLAVAGQRDTRLDQASDAVCTALQLTNFWQDFERDWQKGRLYLPLDECRRAGAEASDLDAGRMTPAWLSVMEQAAFRTEELFERGRYVCDGVAGRLRWELRFTWLGGRRVLARLQHAGHDVFRGRPVLGAADVPALLWQALRWRAR